MEQRRRGREETRGDARGLRVRIRRGGRCRTRHRHWTRSRWRGNVGRQECGVGSKGVDIVVPPDMMLPPDMMAGLGVYYYVLGKWLL